MAFTVCGAVFAQGSTEVWQSAATLAGTGAAIGSAIGPIGSLSGAFVGALGAGLGALGGYVLGGAKQEAVDEAERLDYKNRYLESKKAEVSYQSQIEQNELLTSNAETQISGYDQALSRWDKDVSLQMSQFKQQGESQYSQLMSNFANTQMAMAQKGQTGGSSAIFASVAKQQVQDFAGSNMTLTSSGGGTFAKILEKTQQDLSDQYKSSLLGKQDLYSAIENYQSAKGTAQAGLIEQQGLTEDFRKKAGIKEN